MSVKTFYLESLQKGLQRKPTGLYYILLSGGVESVCSYLLATQYREVQRVKALFFDYGQPNAEAELYCVEMLCDEERVPLRRVDLKGILNPMKPGVRSDAGAFVPARNLVFFSIALHEIHHHDADGLIVGHSTLVDEGTFYDNSRFFWRQMELEAARHLARDVRVLMPTANLTKAEIMKVIYEDYSKQFDKIVSCWNAKLLGGRIVTCGECAQCKEFAEARSLVKVV